VVELPQTQYVETPEGAYLAYQTFGRGSLDLLVPMNGGVAVELAWEEPVISPPCATWHRSPE
jgi:hypothetical protein